MSAYIKSYDGKTKWMYFSIEDLDLIKKYNDSWNKVCYSTKKEYDFELICNKKFFENENKIS